MLRKLVFLILGMLAGFQISAQLILDFPITDINELILNGSCKVEHSTFDIGSIYDVFDHRDETHARSQNINPLVITLTFPHPVTFSGAEILHVGGDGEWSLEAADTPEDLDAKTGSYEAFFTMTPISDGVKDQLIFFIPETKKIIRMTVRRTTGDDYVHLGEWQLISPHASVELDHICVVPPEIWMLPNSSYEVELKGFDSLGYAYPIVEDVIWTADIPNFVNLETTEEGIKVHSTDVLSTAPVQAYWDQYDISALSPVHVVENFSPEKAETRRVKIALVIIDPPIAAEGGIRFHERFGWDNPTQLAATLIDSLNAVSEGVVQYEIFETIDDQSFYTALEGTFVTIDSMYRLFLEPGWTTFHQLEQTGGYFFDYNALLNNHYFCTLSDQKYIDEVWVYSMPFTGMYESRLTGDGAFWYNAPPLDSNSCVDQLPIMGFNYERGVAEAMHSFGHRVESAMAHTFGRWDYNATDKNDWELFTLYDLIAPGEAHVGNIHFPPNGGSDYDYNNPFGVLTYHENWSRYPFLFDEQEYVGSKQWDHSHLGYMSWWFRHLPRFTCKNRDGILNNWWSYIVDYNEGKRVAKETSDCDCDFVKTIVPVKDLNNNFDITVFPNPANDFVTIHAEQDLGKGILFELTNPQGIPVQSFLLEPHFTTKVLDVSSVPSGSYLVVVRDEFQRVVFSEKIVIAH